MFELFQYDFMVRAIVAGMLIGAIAPAIGTFLVVRRYSLMADTLAHAALAGVAIGLFLGSEPVITALVVAILASAGIEILRVYKNVFGESALAFFLYGGLAVAVVVTSLADGFNANFFTYLFGSIATVSTFDLYLISGIGALILTTLYLLFNELFLISLDEEIALASGIRARVINFILVALTALVVALSMRIVGALLVGALMVIPVMTSILYKKGFRITFFLSILISVLSVLSGLIVSYYWALAPGGTIVLILILLFVISTLLNKK